MHAVDVPAATGSRWSDTATILVGVALAALVGWAFIAAPNPTHLQQQQEAALRAENQEVCQRLGLASSQENLSLCTTELAQVRQRHETRRQQQDWGSL